MYLTKKVRLNRLLNGGRCLDVAIDHGVCNEPSFMTGSRTWRAWSDRWSRPAPTRSR